MYASSNEQCSLGFRELIAEADVLNEIFQFARQAAPPRSSTSATKGVLLIPGFLAGDASLFPLAGSLRRAGHETFFAGIWCNAGLPEKTLERLEAKLEQLKQQLGAKLVLIGHSLGGLYARELARRHPELVERAILLGSPIKNPFDNVSPYLKGLARAAMVLRGASAWCESEACWLCGLRVETSAPSVPETIIYSKRDGLVNWRSCIETGLTVEAIEVTSTHCGMACNGEVMQIILERLGQRPTPRLVANHQHTVTRQPTRRSKRLLHLIKSTRSVA